VAHVDPLGGGPLRIGARGASVPAPAGGRSCAAAPAWGATQG
jgi:hypothetical protein